MFGFVRRPSRRRAATYNSAGEQRPRIEVYQVGAGDDGGGGGGGGGGGIGGGLLRPCDQRRRCARSVAAQAEFERKV